MSTRKEGRGPAAYRMLTPASPQLVASLTRYGQQLNQQTPTVVGLMFRIPADAEAGRQNGEPRSRQALLAWLSFKQDKLLFGWLGRQTAALPHDVICRRASLSIRCMRAASSASLPCRPGQHHRQHTHGQPYLSFRHAI